MENEVLFNLDGNVATMKVYEDRVVITGKKNVLGFLTKTAFNGAKEIYFVDLTSVQYKEASKFINGFIQFEYPGSHSGENNYNSENTFVIDQSISNIEDCKKAYEYIKEKVLFYKKNKNSGGFSQADELKKFKELLDAGIITEKEFEDKKKSILGL